MEQDPLADLLKQADSPPTTSTVLPSRLAAKVRSTVRARRTRRRTAAVAAVVVCIAGAAMVISRGPREEVVQTRPPAATEVTTADVDQQIEEEAARLRAEADSLERIVRRTIALRRIDELREMEAAEPLSVEATLEIQDLADRAAIGLLARAESKINSDRAEAVAAFRRTIDLFPGTEWAVAARNQLARIEKGRM